MIFDDKNEIDYAEKETADSDTLNGANNEQCSDEFAMKVTQR